MTGCEDVFTRNVVALNRTLVQHEARETRLLSKENAARVQVVNLDQGDSRRVALSPDDGGVPIWHEHLHER